MKRSRLALLAANVAIAGAAIACNAILDIEDHELASDASAPTDGSGAFDGSDDGASPPSDGAPGADVAPGDDGGADAIGSDAGPSDDASNDGGLGDGSANDGGGNDAGDAAPPPPVLRQVTVGDSHACALYADGSVYCWGDNTLGSVGKTPGTTPLLAQKVAGLPLVTSISAGTGFTCAIDTGSRVWCWGADAQGQLGRDGGGDSACGTAPCDPAPQQITQIFASAVEASVAFACALTTNQTVACWGSNAQAQLGVAAATVAASGAPLTIKGLPKIAAIGASYPGGSACAIDIVGRVWCWGDNTYGELGHAPGTDGDVLTGKEYSNPTPSRIGVLADGGDTFSDAVAVTGGKTPCALRRDGTVWCWGDNAGGNLGNGVADTLAHPTPTRVTTLNAVIAVHAGNSDCAQIDGGAVMCWGSSHWVCGGKGTMACTSYRGDDFTDCSLTPTAVSGVTARGAPFDVDHVAAAALDVSGKLVMWGQNQHAVLGHPLGTTGDVDAGGSISWVNPTPTPVVALP